MEIRKTTARQFSWARTTQVDGDVQNQVRRIVDDVRVRGDEALFDWTATLDCAQAGQDHWTARVPEAELAVAWDSLDTSLQAAIQAAAKRIRHFHELQRPADFSFQDGDEARLGLTWRPIRRVGVYAPGGRAAYPSTVLMNVIAAQVAGVGDIVLVSPPQAATGLPHPLVLGAAYALGLSTVIRAGGAQAIAALAYGTRSLERVDKLAGPGNLYVTLAKREVMGDVGIDSLAGPSEVFIVADHTANPAYVAADMLAQAEHDPEAGAVCVLTDAGLADGIVDELTTQLGRLPRRVVAQQALERWGALVVADSMAEALEVVNRSAPEHVELLVAHPDQWLNGIECAGAVFLGPFTPEPVGDYYAGTNHVLPTHGTARFASGLGVADFLRRMTYVAYTERTLMRHAADIVQLAEAEGLTAHARAIAVRLADCEHHKGDGKGGDAQ